MAPNPDWTSDELLARLRSGDEQAAEEMFSRYIERLTLLARARLTPRLASRTDPEDVVMSAWRSFFLGARSGRFALRRSGDLWRLLASITMHKLYRQARRHSAEMRSVKFEQSLDATSEESLPIGNQEPTPEEALAVAEELEAVMSQLDDFGRRVLELRLQGEQLATIADDTGRSERTVRRVLEQIRRRLAERLEADDDILR